MVVNVPTAFTSSADAAQALTRTLGLRPRHHRDKPVFAVWLGNDDQATATLNAARVPTYPTEAEAVRGFQHLVRYREAQNALMETPPSLPQDFNVDAAAARALVDAAHLDKVMGDIARAEREGARLLLGAHRVRPGTARAGPGARGSVRAGPGRGGLR
ncbi:hypothetical protein G6F63_014542 [Rhizopus arrhizus]|nr:hypothetical protein G6F63_014542 [Rhizopus arrhizus]